MSAIDVAIFTKLGAAAGLTALVSTRIYARQAPQGAALPYVIFSHQAGGQVNMEPVDRLELVYWIRGFATTQAAAGAIDDQISAALHRQTLTATGWAHLGCQRESDQRLEDRDAAGALVWITGALYRIRAQST
jgi:hypothetical protein